MAPFEANEVRKRKGGGGIDLHYITARTAMNRLDQVAGPENWEDEYRGTKDGLVCRLSITLPDGRVITKEDGGGFADMADEDDAEKSGYSSAFKRAAVKFGIGRYLYKDGMPQFARDQLGKGNGQSNGPAPSKPLKAEPVSTPPPVNESIPQEALDAAPADCPPDGRGFYRFVCDFEKRNNVKVFSSINAWGKEHGCPFKMV